MIGIFGGTFDPVHFGHIKPALSVKQSLGLEQLRFIPNRLPPHREQPWLDVDQRLDLLKAALADVEDAVIDRRELDREGPSYMVDTLRSLQQAFPSETLVLIIGMDAFLGIPRWHEWRALFDLCHVVVTMRPGFSPASIETSMDPDDYRFLSLRMTEDDSQLMTQTCGQILLKSVPQLDISSTEIRRRLRAGQDVCELMPAAACERLMAFDTLP